MRSSFQSSRLLNKEQKDFLLVSLNSICEQLDLTQTQLDRIETAYEAVGNHLASSDDALLKDAQIYVQGSVRLRTTVKPIGKDEFDIDLICYLPNSTGCTRDEMLAAVDKRLKESDRYKSLVVPLSRGFRIDYAGDYHLDITPARDHELMPLISGHAIWVPDKREQWKESNAKGMAEWFDTIKRLTPKQHQSMLLSKSQNNETVEQLPNQSLKAPLNRIIQILKRHRDEWAEENKNQLSEYKPISVLITTLASLAYESISIGSSIYTNDFDILLDVIELMPEFIITDQFSGEIKVCNPSMKQENYAEKWNRTKNNEGNKLRQAFDAWHRNAIEAFDDLANQQGQGEDNFFNSLGRYFGERPVQATRNNLIGEIAVARKSGQLFSQTGIGLLSTSVSLNAAKAVATPSNTFFGNNPVAPTVPVKQNSFYGK